MMTRPRFTASQIDRIIRRVSDVEKERSEHAEELDVEQIERALQSPSARIRAKAVRSLCPCHTSWETFLTLRKEAGRLRRDPDAKVRACALHIEEDAREVAQAEALAEWLTDEEASESKFRRGKRWSRCRT
ncbi:MAG TPA: hypothetical protein VGS41_06370 [Chthonomonadales bacterium]|nr:hypothetical protein [Chthonomonadales bacterium]